MGTIFYTILIVILIIRSPPSTDAREIRLAKNQLDSLAAVTADLVFHMRAQHCYTIITDHMFQHIFTVNMMREMAFAGYLVILVADYEDMLEPNERFVNCLLEAQRSGCDTYLIYLGNGIQAERLIRFIDRKRLVDTRVKFIMLHDYRLFAGDLHYLWKRIVNVVFVRQYDRSVRGGRVRPGTWFELSTVPFPMAVRDVLVPRRLDFWRAGRFQKGSQQLLMADKSENLRGREMRGVVLRHTPAVAGRLMEDKEVMFSGLEIEIMKAVSESMNFTIEFYETPDADEEKWGRVYENGSASGLIGEMVQGLADFALADLYYNPYHLDKMDLSWPYTTQCLTFLTPEALTDNSWQTLTLPFSSEMWICVVFFLGVVVVFFYTIGQIHLRLRRADAQWHRRCAGTPRPQRRMRIVKVRKVPRGQIRTLTLIQFTVLPKEPVLGIVDLDIFDSFGNCMFYSWSMLLVVSLPRLPQSSWSIRVLTGWYWIYCVLVVVAYRASLTAILANPTPRLTIDTLEELANSRIECGAWGEQNKVFFMESVDEISQQIGQSLVPTDNAKQAVDRVAEGAFAYFESEFVLKQLRAQRTANTANTADRQTLHIMDECAVHMPIAIGLERNSPIRERFDVLLQRLVESGLTAKWLGDAKRLYESSVEEEPQEALMELRKLYGGFVALGIGFGLATVVLAGELAYWRWVVVKRPDYDPYAMRRFYS